MPYSIEAQIGDGSSLVEVRNYYWPEPLDEIVEDDHPVFGLSLSPVPLASRARFGDAINRRNFDPIGSVLYRPPRLPMHCRNAGGSQRLVMCALPVGASSSAISVLVDRLSGSQPMLDVRKAEITATLRRLAAEACAPGFACGAVVEALSTTLLVDFLRIARPENASKMRLVGGLAPWQRRRIDEALHDIDGPAPSVSELATLIGVSSRHLLRAFRVSVGRTVAKHIQQVRAGRACKILLSTKLPIKAVAARCGFASAGAFTTAFRREIGLTPRDYRMRMTR